MFSQLTDSLEGVLKKVRGQGKLTEENIGEALREVRRAFLEADVNFTVTRDFVNAVKEKALGEEVLTAVAPGQLIVKILHDELVKVLGGTSTEPRLDGKPPVGILMVGLQGSGKTTFSGKLALHLRSKRKRKPLLVACDVYRPAAIQQLQVLGKSIGIPVFEQGQGDPVAIAKAGRKFAEENGHDIVIYDTAGRLQVDEQLMQEVENIRKAVEPQEVFFVADAMIGQEAVNVASEFFRRLTFTGVCLSKLDGDTRGGAALSIRKMTGVPVTYVGTGEKLPELELFHPERMAGRILGMGDVVSLVERAQQAIEEKDAKDMRKKLMAGKFDLEDYLSQLRMIKKMGSLRDLMGLIPGMKQFAGANIDEKQLVRVESVLSSMTKRERKQPEIINGSRRKRIATGSGNNLQQVNLVMSQYEQMKKMIGQMGKMTQQAGPGGALKMHGGQHKFAKKKK